MQPIHPFYPFPPRDQSSKAVIASDNIYLAIWTPLGYVAVKQAA